MIKHTEGPWSVTSRRDIAAEVWGEGRGWHEIALNVDTAENAALIAATPQIYKALINMTNSLEALSETGAYIENGMVMDNKGNMIETLDSFLEEARGALRVKV